ncbi:molybdopterin-dependent oxidoreductase [Roseateles sp. SL47]|uniref:xanthine dehydrogenase family protein molybdopterin-binding subunit n=1 Tax=Roseateles sp. SL47 TaxID=2995138 RepID=UPI0022710F2F|nr:molybdopterin cofactor-binding domain-containing protein [Roseateles sp. SL47]WAC71939.1 molybdopterin-dependent oxidoreductase [Roseateles sp. SL47]
MPVPTLDTQSTRQADGRGTTRRHFIVLAGAGAGLALGLPATGAVGGGDAPLPPDSPQGAGLNRPFVRIAPDGLVTVIVKHLEMGQGIASGLATVVAEELDADWAQLRTEAAPFDPALYRHTVFGFQTTGGSTSMANSWQQLREAGAVARAMLVSAAALRWSVPAEELTTHRGQVLHGPSGRRIGYGALSEAAAALPVPTEVPLKSPASFGLIGREQRRLGVHDIVQGRSRYGMDIQRPGMLVAVLQRPTRFGSTIRSVDASAALAMPGVRAVHQLSSGVAVLADNSWLAIEARRLLKIEWDDSKAEQRSTADLRANFRALAGAGDPGVEGLKRGHVDEALAGAAKVLEADFELPYLAHQPMEPIASVGELRDGRCDIWAASQNPSADHAAAVKLLGLPAGKVVLHGLPAGGSFGRRATFNADWISELAQILSAQRERGDSRPVKLMWTREDDIGGGYYRPMSLHRLKVGMDATGRIIAAKQTIVAQSFSRGRPRPGVVPRHDPFITEGHLAERYDVPHAHTCWINPDVGVPVHTYRALGHNHTTFSKEVMMDELAALAGQDALAFRLAHLREHPRQAHALRIAADKAGWGRPLPAGSALGMAVQEAYHTVVAQVAQVRINRGLIVVERVVCVVDCGLVVNPGTVRAQMEGGIAFGLSAALHNEITLEGGRVQQSNFHDAPILRLHEMPVVDVHLVPSDAPPTGVGEPGSVPILGAVANAVARLTGKPVRALPLRLDGSSS